MFGLFKLGRTALKFTSYLRSARQISHIPIRYASTKKLPSLGPSKIHLIAPHLRKSTHRRRRPLALMFKEEDNLLPKVTGMAKCESYDLCAIFEDEHLGSFYQVTFVDEDSEDALHITLRSEYRIDQSIKDAFVFADGVIVTWNFNDEELSQLTDFLNPHENDSHDPGLVNQETETISYTSGTGPRISIKNDIINLARPEEASLPAHIDILDRFAVSHALAASVKIAIWEQRLNDYAEPLEETTRLLMQGNIPWNRKESLQKTGEFAALRQSINLDSGLLNTDFYWERDNLERSYNVTIKYFIVDKRLRELNTRLDYCQQFCSIIDDMITHRHASRLEWFIIWLIVIEVIFDLLHYFKVSPNPVYIVEKPKDIDE